MKREIDHDCTNDYHQLRTILDFQVDNDCKVDSGYYRYSVSAKYYCNYCYSLNSMVVAVETVLDLMEHWDSYRIELGVCFLQEQNIEVVEIHRNSDCSQYLKNA